MVGRTEEARALFERLLALGNDVGLLSEEYDPRSNRLVGNFPQAFSHVGLIGTALLLEGDGPILQRLRQVPDQPQGDGGGPAVAAPDRRPES